MARTVPHSLCGHPSCSVLSVTVLGTGIELATLVRPRGCAASRIAAVWKEPDGPTLEIELDDDPEAVMLSHDAKE